MIMALALDIDSGPQSSLFLALPREIRDLIYHHALVRETIPINTAAINYAQTTVRSPGFRNGLMSKYPSRFAHHYRRIWTVASFDLDVDFGTYDLMDEPRNVQLTYQLHTSRRTFSRDIIDIGLLQTCRQIYAEAVKIFYSRNTFTFLDDGVPAAFAFLCDRPAASLRMISSIGLGLSEDNNMSGTSGAHYPDTRRATDNLTLQYVYHHYTDLCTLLSTSRTQLRSLSLTINNHRKYYDSAPNTMEECLSWEFVKTEQSRPFTPDWLLPLLNVQGFESIMLLWVSTRPRLRRMADTAALMRQEMLAGRQSIQDSPTCSADFDFWMLQQGDSTSHNLCVRFDVLRESLEHKVAFHKYWLNGNELWQAPRLGPTVQEEILHDRISTLMSSQGQNTTSVYASYCELRNI